MAPVSGIDQILFDSSQQILPSRAYNSLCLYDSLLPKPSRCLSCFFLSCIVSLGPLLSAGVKPHTPPPSFPSSLCPLSSVAGVKSSLLSSHQSAGIWSMPRSLCAAKRQIKESVISSAASAADSCVAVAEAVGRAGRGYASAMCCWRDGWGNKT